MGPLIALDPEVKEKIEEARSFPNEPPGMYIGSENRNGRMYHYYKNGLEYFYETDYDREMRAQQRERKWNRERRVGKTYSQDERCGKVKENRKSWG